MTRATSRIAERPGGNVRWAMALLFGVSVVINYFDRTNLSIAAPALAKDFRLTPLQLGFVFSYFSYSYTLMQFPVGVLLDRIGVTWITRVGVAIWGVVTFLTGFVNGLGLLFVYRILLGIAEAPAFPAASKATGYWFPLHERGLATSSFDAAAKFSSVIGAPAVGLAVTLWGWRGAFWSTGILNCLFAVVFWLYYRDPKDHRGVSKEELHYIEAYGAQRAGESRQPYGQILRTILGSRKVWGLTIGFMAYGYSFYMFLNWLPSYLVKQMHMGILTSGLYTAVPWLVATLTDIFIGGWLVDALIAHGHRPTAVRKGVLVAGMVFGMAVLGATSTSNPVAAVTWIAIALGGLAASAPVGWSIPAIVAPTGAVGAVGSIMNFFNNLMGILAPIVTGYIVGAEGSFGRAFVLAAAVLVIGILAYVFMLGDISQIDTQSGA